MASKTSLATLRAASLTLTASLAAVVGTVSTDNADATTGAVKLAGAQRVRIVLTYTRHASSSSGKPKLRVMVSADAPTTDAGSVSRWTAATMRADGASSGGVLDLVPEVVTLGPSAAGATVFTTAPIDVQLAHWMRLDACDTDAANLGAVSLVGFVVAA